MTILDRATMKLRWVLPVAAAAVIAGACDLDVADPDVVRDDELSGPSAVPTTVAGVIGDLANMTEDYVLYTSLFTDEMILGGTFPTRHQVDERRVLDSNSTVTTELNEALHAARDRADRMIDRFSTEFLGDETFDQQAVLEGIAIGSYVRALTKLELGELYCAAPVEGGGEPLASAEVVAAAVEDFDAAEAAAGEAGLEAWANASRLGRARAHLFLGSLTGDASHFDAAATAAADVPTTHRLLSEFSSEDPEQFNKVNELTFGSQNEVIRWTVGDGSQGERQNEAYAEYDTFVELGIVDPCTGDCADQFEAFSSTIAVQLQLLYDEPSDDIVLSSGIHARLIEAEAALRDGATGAAEDLVNAVRDDWAQRWSAERFRVESDLEDVAFTGDLQADLLTLLSEYARETWLTGVRQENLRRMVEEFGAGSALDLYPVREGNQVCWPVPEQEEDGASP